MNSPAKLLIVEDSPVQAAMLRRILLSAGYDVRSTEDGVSALEILNAEPIDLVLTDVKMPKMNGVELCQAIKQSSSLRTIKVIIVTTLSDPLEIAMGANAGADDYVVKPYQSEYLLSKVAAELASPAPDTTNQREVSSPIRFSASGKDYDLEAPSTQIVKLMISTYENAIQQNRELLDTQVKLNVANRDLEHRLAELTTTEARARSSEERYRSLVELIGDIVFRIDPTGHIVYVNEAVSQLGWSAKELSGHHLSELLSEQNAPLIERMLEESEEALRSPDPNESLTYSRARIEVEIPYQAAANDLDDVFFGEISFSATAEFDEKWRFTGVVGTIHDITERKLSEQRNERMKELLEVRVLERTEALNQSKLELEETMVALKNSQAQIMQAEKMSAVGTLVAGVAHELNNPLMGALNYIEYLSGKISDPKLLGYLEKAQSSIERANKIVRGLLSFSRPASEDHERINIPDIVEKTIGLLGADFRHKGIEIVQDTAEDLPDILANSTEVQQVILNLLMNARDAMEASNEKIVTIRGAVENGQIVIEVRDTGPGIPAERLARIFDPFFTTKAVGKGTGLGLTISSNIMKSFGGSLECDSTEGKGTAFTLKFPLEPAPQEPAE